MIDADDPLSLLSALPPIRRARGYRLYAAGGARLVDLWQYGGRAALGHTPPGVLLAVKDVASRGLSAPLPGPYLARLEKLLSRLAPGNPVPRVYPDAAAAGRAFAAAGYDPAAFSSAADPALAAVPEGAVCALWRPWLPAAPEAPVLRAVLPAPWPVAALLLRPEAAARFPPSSLVPPLSLAALHRATADLLGSLEGPPEDRFAALDRAIAARPASLRPARRGPYLRFAEASDAERYAALFGRALAAGLLLSPDPALPSIVPPDLSGGETAALAAFLKEG